MKVWVIALIAFLLIGAPSNCRADDTTSTKKDDVDSKKSTTFRQGAETHAFQAEVSRLMDIIVHSLYSNKDIFLRELVSNAADALDKVRFLSLTNSSALGQGKAATLPFEIKISIDKERKILSIQDTGIGMTKTDLINNLGTIARSGTAAFLEQMQKGGDLSLIGQFGVGFYSVYLVSDYVEVITKNVASDTQYVWESSASGQFAVSEDTTGESLERGTRINIHIKDSESEYLEESKIKELIARYSEFIQFPISLLTKKEVEKEVIIEEEEDGKEEKKKGEETGDVGVEEEEEEDQKEKKPKTKMVKETVEEWEVLNSAKALWLRPPGDVTEQEYTQFYHALAKTDSDPPLAHTHFRAEGDVDFKTVLYIPKRPPPDMYQNYYTTKPRVRLYVRRVLISDSFEDLLPKWLSFLVGLVDSDSMPLNVSREMLQLSEGLRVIKKKLVRKGIEMIKKLSDAEMKAYDSDEENTGGKSGGWFGKKKGKDGDDQGEEEKKKNDAVQTYHDFWKQFGKAIKMGVVEDASNRKRLLPLLRFTTSVTGTNLTSFDAYISRMKENQTSIYYLVSTGHRAELEKSPFVERLVSKGYEVIYFNEALDEYMMQAVNDYEDKSFINISKDDVKLQEEDTEEERTKEKRAAAHYKGIATWWKSAINDSSISSVKVSRRLASSPCVVVSGKYGWTATMEKIVRAQALNDGAQASFLRGQRVLEINPRHPLIKELRAQWSIDPENIDLKSNAKLLYEVCLLESGFMLDDVSTHNQRILSLLGNDLNIYNVNVMEEEEEYPELESEKKKKVVEEEKESGNDGVSKDEL